MKILFTCILLLGIQISFSQTTLSELTKTKGFDTTTTPALEKDATADSTILVYDSFQVKKFNFAFKQNQIVYGWQNISSVIIFFVVILVVLMGLYLSYRQFIMAEKLMMLKREVQTIEKGNTTVEVMNASLEMGKDGVKINTAVIGLVILIISLSFLFLYLKYVYPISIVKEDFPTAITPPNALQ